MAAVSTQSIPFEMEGVLWTREGRSPLLRGWHKRYFVLSKRSGTLREYVLDADKKQKLLARARRASSGASSTSSASSPNRNHNRSSTSSTNGRTLRRELAVRGSSVKTLPFPLVGKQHAFQVTLVSQITSSATWPPCSATATATATATCVAIKVVLSARQADDMRQWITALKTAAMNVVVVPNRRPSSPIGWNHRNSDETTIETPTPSDVVEVPRPQRADMALLSSVYEWIHEGCVKTSQSLLVAGVHVPSGSLLVGVNGVMLHTLPPSVVRKLLLESTGPLPVSLRFLRAPAKTGVLCAKLSSGPLTQFQSLASRYRTSSRKSDWNWTEHVVHLSGTVLTCQVNVATPAVAAVEKSQSRTLSMKSKSNKTLKRVFLLNSRSSAQSVHDWTAERPFCFTVTVDTHALVFQATSESDRRAWIDAVRRAIAIAEGVEPGAVAAAARESFDVDTLQLQSAMNMRHVDDQVFADVEGSDGAFFIAHDDKGGANEAGTNAVPAPPLLPSAEDWTSATKSAAYLPGSELTEMLRILQSSGRFIEALQLIQKNTSLRSKYWQQIFQWALDPARALDEKKEGFQQLIGTALSKEYAFSVVSCVCSRDVANTVSLCMCVFISFFRDDLQVQKDIPRTAKWLAGSAGAPKLDDDERAVRLESLGRVLHAFLSSCSLDVRTDENPLSPSSTRLSTSSSPCFYMQGMNGLAFILLEVLESDEIEAFRFLRGIIARILPHVFGICCDGTGRDHFDLFRSLVEVGDVLQEVVGLHLPCFHAALEQAGLPVCLLAYKWFPTLFSDVTLTASHSQLRFDTLMCCWDVCLLLGLEGMFCVALALCSAAEDDVLALAGCGSAVSNSAELVSAAVGRSLALLSPEDLVTNVCEVLELCSHPVMLKLRNAHRRRLKLGYSKVGNGFATSNNRTSPDRIVKKKPCALLPPIMVTDLDSGKVFKISTSGRMLPSTTATQMK
uniref:PH domain-containing protein n=1 Tax=Hyaloperonospora arabidopsidis (strain Emoy2) TaxID=559515 RepID=M4BNE4_HYAAE